jgi:hypothetical protein
MVEGSFYIYFLIYHKQLLYFIKYLFHIYWVDHVVLILHSFNMVYEIDWFSYIKPTFQYWDKPHWSMVYIHWCTQFHKTKTTENKEIDSDTIKVKNLILDSVNKYIIQAKKNKIK